MEYILLNDEKKNTFEKNKKKNEKNKKQTSQVFIFVCRHEKCRSIYNKFKTIINCIIKSLISQKPHKIKKQKKLYFSKFSRKKDKLLHSKTNLEIFFFK